MVGAAAKDVAVGAAAAYGVGAANVAGGAIYVGATVAYVGAAVGAGTA